MNLDKAGQDFIKNHEGCSLTSYKDSVGIWTIGYGHAYVYEGMAIDQDQADQFFLNDIYKFEICVNKLVTVPLNQSQFNALVDFSFNLGAHSLAESTLLKDLNNSDYDAAGQQFLVWDKCGGVTNQGLLNRRQDELDLWES